MQDGEKYFIFRHLKVKKKPAEKSAVFKVRFTLSGMLPEKNKKFSLIPIPFFAGLPGFRAKFWMLNEETGAFQGLYEWSSRENAEKYSKSFAMNFMKMRSVKGSASFEIIPDKTLEQYYIELTGKNY